MLEYSERRAYLTQLLSDHRRLELKLRDLRDAIEAAPRNESAPEERIVDLLCQVRDELQSHFEGEEDGGYLDEAVARLPRLSAKADRVQAEHSELLGELEQLIELAGKLPSAGDRFLHRLDAFYQQLHQHERAEDQILREGFSLTDNGEDMIH